MPLQIEVESLENITAELQGLYVEHEAKWRLDVADLDSFVESRVPATERRRRICNDSLNICVAVSK